jgi:site-specific recombinase XerD
MSYEHIVEVKEYLDFIKLNNAEGTFRSYSLAIGKFFSHFNIQSFEDIKNITVSQCRAYQSSLLDSGNKRTSANAYTRPLKTLFTWLVENEYLGKSPFDRIQYLKTEKSIPAFLTNDEVDGMIKACDKLQDKLILAILLSTGLRRNELVTLKLEDFQGEHIVVRGKGNKQRRLILEPKLSILLSDYVEIRNKKYGNTTPYLFVSKMGDKYSGEAIRQKIQTIGRKAGLSEERLDQIHTHTMRHTFAANLLESGADIKILQVGLGHASLSTTSLIYAHIRDSVLDNAMLNQRAVI